MFLNCEGGSENWKVVRGELRQGCPLCGVSHSSREDCEVRGSRLLSLLVGRGWDSGWAVIVYYCMVGVVYDIIYCNATVIIVGGKPVLMVCVVIASEDVIVVIE